MKKNILGIILIFIAIGCKKPEFKFKDNGELFFSADTVFFDSIFVSIKSPTKRLIVVNKENYNLRIKRIFLQGGNSSYYNLIIDGVDTNVVYNYELMRGDSFYIFINFKHPSGYEGTYEDKIIFETEDNKYEVPLVAKVFDAYLLRDTVLDCNYTFPTDKPVIIDGYCIIDSNCVATILSGSRVYFTSRSLEDGRKISGIYVFGTLRVLGSPGNEVLFTSVRLDGDYIHTAGQWNGLRFLPSSFNNEIHYAKLRNGTYGIEVDSSTNNSVPKLVLKNTEIRDFGAYGLLLLGFSEAPIQNRLDVYCENVLIHNCAYSCVGIIGGGAYSFMNCTIANYSYDFRRLAPAFIATDYYKFSEADIRYYDLNLGLYNSVVWGSEEEELVFDVTGNKYLGINIKYCDIKATKITGLDTTVLVNKDPKFVNPTIRSDTISFKLQEGSPLINFGDYFNGNAPMIDIEGNQRVGRPDLGCYEFF